MQKIKKNDIVQITKGKDKGKQGKLRELKEGKEKK